MKKSESIGDSSEMYSLHTDDGDTIEEVSMISKVITAWYLY